MDEDMSPWFLVGVLANVRESQEEELNWRVRLSYVGMSSGPLVVRLNEFCLNVSSRIWRLYSSRLIVIAIVLSFLAR